MSVFFLDFAHDYQIFFQDSAAPQMDGIVYLHNYIMSLESGILVFVCYIAFICIFNFFKSYRNNASISVGNTELYFSASNQEEILANNAGLKNNYNTSVVSSLTASISKQVSSLLSKPNNADTFVLSNSVKSVDSNFSNANNLVLASLVSGNKRPQFNVAPSVAGFFGLSNPNKDNASDRWLFDRVNRNLEGSLFNNMFGKYLLDSARVSHGSFIEVVWTLVPSVILLFIAFPSFALLYALEESFDSFVNIKVIGHQWYWSYEYYLPLWGKSISEDSYMVATDELKMGELRLLEVDNPLILPIKSYIRLIISSFDVLHCWTVPSLGVKVDAVPGRLNQAFLFMKRAGIFYGQCSELCGIGHGFMPIAVHGVPLSLWMELIDELSQAETNNLVDEAPEMVENAYNNIKSVGKLVA